MRKKIFISGANLFSGGTLSIMEDCLNYADKYLTDDYEITGLVYKKSLFQEFQKIKLIEFPNVRKSYFHRFYNEYFHYKSLTENEDIFLWLSLNDMSSRITSQKKAVYFHNPSPFRKPALMDLIGQPRWFLFTLFYRFLYKINIKSNNYIIVQQDWLRSAFVKMFSLDKSKVIVALPESSEDLYFKELPIIDNLQTHFFYPTFPRPFKNIEVICKAVEYINSKFDFDFKVTITIDGSENGYSRALIRKYKANPNLNFVGLISRTEVFEYYSKVNCLIFPSKLETWGLPISEFKSSNKPILLSDLPYAHETLGRYDQGCFFPPDSYIDLAKLMISVINKEDIFESHLPNEPSEPTSKNWDGLFKILLKN